MPVLRTLILALALGAPAVAEPPRDERPLTIDDRNVCCVSLLGLPLMAPPIAAEKRAMMEADLAAARAAYAASGDSASAIWVGRRQAYLYRYKDAIATFSEALRKDPESPTLLRHRGHRFLTLRRITDAISDLSQAARLIDPAAPAVGVADAPEPDGQPNEKNLPRSTTNSNIYYHLGLAYYVKGDLESAAGAYKRCMDFAKVNDDMLVATTHWYYMTLRRLGRHEEAAALLEPIKEQMDIIENHAYHRALLMYKGVLTPDQILAERPSKKDSAKAIERLTLTYAVASWYQYHEPSPRQTRTKARPLLEELVKDANWPAFAVLAAEADLARIMAGAPAPAK